MQDYDELFSEFRLFNAKGELMRAFSYLSPSVAWVLMMEFDKKQAPPTGSPKRRWWAKSGWKYDTRGFLYITSNSTTNSTKNTQESELFSDAGGNAGSW